MKKVFHSLMIRNSRTGYFASSPFIYLIFSWKIWFQTWKWKQNIWWRERSRIDEFLLRNILVLHSQKITKNAVLLAFGVKLAPNIFLSELTSQTPKNKWEVLKKKKSTDCTNTHYSFLSLNTFLKFSINCLTMAFTAVVRGWEVDFYCQVSFERCL